MTFNCKDLKPGDVCVMRGGKEAVFLGVNPYAKKMPYVFAHDKNCSDVVYQHCEDGRFYHEAISGYDIIRKKPAKITKWMNVYHGWVGHSLVDTKEQADDEAASHRIACIKFEFEEGEGL